MEAIVVALVGAFGAVGFFVWQRKPRFPSSPNELRDDNFACLYDGLNAESGSKSANDEVREALRGYGDDLSRQREVQFWAYRRSDHEAASVEVLREHLSQFGYDGFVENAGEGGMTFNRTVDLNSMAFDKSTMDLNELLFEYGWEYDGWESPVIQDEDNTR